ncbi:T9SS type A sorting domain-containing protein [Hymenobacter sp. BT186]|uniref:T9SS type A sorting domain-containing protein n=1 Tax=Hymenobacter telluris TaxID=2816474 RepID=A0A939ETL4_9BACT|nr:M43 family zinc metalloprotease [Hymenobacter telluris]MBO0356914.1 T9SS type A sorting domain-containing protein [Hymenobacter telluris]MBW3372941.1 T9SS type A sorting domain-containing protein [Hymenobacter norwichensis]
MKGKFYALVLSLLGLASATSAQEFRLAPDKALTPPGRQCATMEVLQAQLAADPSLAQRMASVEAQTRTFQGNAASMASRATAGVVTIPVVVHVVYKTAAENVSTAQVQAQLDVLNKDFAKLNADANLVPAAFAGLAANTNIQFVLAQRDPSGNPTSGIVRTLTKTTSWSSNDAVKNAKRGGSNAWPASSYLNLWVCNLGQGLLGYAQFPGGAASTDGVVVLYSSLPGGSAAPYNKGRTATHEVGHWLNLRHIWGDASCGNDLVSDTPTQQTANYGCPSYPHVTCSNQGDMSMNYMDYTDDACMYMFSTGQSTRMNALFAAGGARASLANSLGGTAPRQLATTSTLSTSAVQLFPNPATQTLNVTLPAEKATAWTVKVYDLLGYEMKQARYNGQSQVAVSGLPQGLYQVVISDGQQTIRQRFQKE